MAHRGNTGSGVDSVDDTLILGVSYLVHFQAQCPLVDRVSLGSDPCFEINTYSPQHATGQDSSSVEVNPEQLREKRAEEQRVWIAKFQVWVEHLYVWLEGLWE